MQGYTMVGNFYFVTKYKLLYSMENITYTNYASHEDEHVGAAYTVCIILFKKILVTLLKIINLQIIL